MSAGRKRFVFKLMMTTDVQLPERVVLHFNVKGNNAKRLWLYSIKSAKYIHV